MARLLSGCVALLVMVVNVASLSAAPPDNVPGRRWEYEMQGDKDRKPEFTGKFRALNGVLFKLADGVKPVRIGSYREPDKKHVVMDVEQGELKGVTRLKLVKNNPDTYKGELKRDKGKVYKITVKIFRE